jgi:hypothetical protein
MPRRPRPAADRFWEKVRESEAGCWLWTGYTHGGYGKFAVAYAKNKYAHRFAYEALVGEIPEGLDLDHLCRVRNCVNPEHLEPVTRAENIRRAVALITHCPHGHAYTPDNIVASNPKRQCRTCHNMRVRHAARARRARAVA